MQPTVSRYLVLCALIGCGTPDPADGLTPRSAPDPATATPQAIALAFRPDLLADLSVPPTSRASLGPVPDQWTIPHAFRRLKTKHNQNAFSIPAPYNITYYGQDRGKDDQYVTVISPTLGPLRYAPRPRLHRRLKNSWSTREGQLVVRLAPGKEAPTGLEVRVPLATATEKSMNFASASRTTSDFALRTLSVDNSLKLGLFLPAPSTASFRIDVPADGRLRSRVHLLSPPVDQGHRSDGASLQVSVHTADASSTIGRVDLEPEQGATIEASLARFGGQTIELRFTTEPGDTPDLDYVFLSNPVVYAPSLDPRRALFVIVDTLRADHLGTYGYPRPTSPNIDAFAQQAVVFDQARAPSPWTLPSILAALYGRKPEGATQAAHIGTRLGRAGWATCAITSNVWLTDPDTIAAGWSSYQGTPRHSAGKQVKRAKACLERHADRDVFLFVHMIDPHLPYAEAKRFRGRFADKAPQGLQGRILTKKAIDAYQAAPTREEQSKVREYLVGRYDQNILAVDEAFGSLLEQVGPDAPVMLTSDHGEELFDRGGYGHGQSLYDELVRVPLIIRAPATAPHRVASPVALMDLVPTWIDVLDIPATQTTSGGVTGWSLVDLLRDVVGETERFSKRPLPLGRLIRSDDEWGVVLGQHKWTTSATQTQLFDVLKDPAERTNLNKTDSATHQDFPTLLAKGLNQTVTMAIRIAGPGRHRKMSGPGSAMVIQHPQGIAAAWTRIDARGEYAKPTIQEGVVTVPWIPNKETPREVFVTLPQGASPMGLHVSRATKDEVISGTVTVMSSADESVLLAIDETENGFTVGRTWQPIPTEDNHIEMRGDVDEELRALGYVE